MNKRVVLAAAAAMVGVGLLGSAQVFAESSSSQNPSSSLVQRIADKFGLKASDVQAVVDQSKKDSEAQRETNYESQLSQYVKDGKITEAQKQLIIAKHKELETSLQANMQNMKSMTPDELKAFAQNKMQDLRNWSKQTGIDFRYLLGKGQIVLKDLPVPSNITVPFPAPNLGSN
jgi:hypothetical protein